MPTNPPDVDVNNMIATCEKALALIEAEASRLRMRLAHLQAIKQHEEKNKPKTNQEERA